MRRSTAIYLWLASVLALCAILAMSLRVAKAADEGPEKRIVVAVLPFEHSSKDRHYEPLAESMGDMIVACLANVEELTFVERAELDKVLKEHELSLSGLADPKTKARVGRLLGAKYILTGGVIVIEKKLKVNAHLFEVETTRVAWSDGAEGKVEKLLPVVRELAAKLANDLDLKLPELKEEDIDKSPEANLHFMRGLGYYYANMLDHAIAEFMKALALKPDMLRARYWIGTCYFDEKEYKHARIEFDRFVLEFPKHELAPRVKEMLDVCASHIEEIESGAEGE